jgi:GNAT superfamily N-acetyltransferase
MQEMPQMTDGYRMAAADDAAALAELSDPRRQQYQAYQPTFWRPAADACERHEPFLRSLVTRDDVIALVHECGDGTVDGFVIATLAPAPPVYDPGGPTCSIDDYCVADPADWDTIGRQLLEYTIAAAKTRGASQVVVVCGHLDAPKRAMLAAAGLTIASEWYTRPL